MADSSDNQLRLYGDLAWVWPIISPPDHYTGETEHFCKLIKRYAQIEVKTALHLGCGGGHNDHFLREHFEVTGVDISEAMLDLARKLNPEITYSIGDMRSVRLGRTFDAVTLLDSVCYMLTAEDLAAAFTTAYEHLNPGGVLLTAPDFTTERFPQNMSSCRTFHQGDVEIVFLENYYDPDPADSTYEATFVYLIRRAGNLQVETDRHLFGLFTSRTWRRLLKKTGFDVRQSQFKATGSVPSTYTLFIGIKPALINP
jgi:SAM-dependent methyltransferase